ncbi:MAG: AraC family transcriptional regulator [Bacteroidota bacterium]
MRDVLLKEGFLGQKMIVLPDTIKQSLRANPVTRSFCITDIGYYPNASNHHRIRKQGAPEYIFIYCVEGSGVLKIKGTRIEVHPNHFFLIPKYTAHEYWATPDNPWSIYWMHFEGGMAQHLLERYHSLAPTLGTIPFAGHRIALFDRIYKILTSDYVAPTLEYANILGLNFIGSFIYSQVENTIDVPATRHLVDEIVEYLQQNLHKSLKAEDISQKFNYSPSYLFHIFKKRTGYSLIHFFNLKKIQKACEYLKYTDLSVKEIGFRLGYQDALYFSRLFKKHMGLSPRAYKNGQHG